MSIVKVICHKDNDKLRVVKIGVFYLDIQSISPKCQNKNEESVKKI